MSHQSTKLSIEEVQQWLGEAQLQIKLRDRVIGELTQEIKRLQEALSKKGGADEK